MRIALALAWLIAAPTIVDAEPGEPPTVVTQAWMRQMHAAGWPLDSLVDKQAGLIVLERNIDAPVDDFKGVVSATKHCGAAVDRALRTLRARLRSGYKTADIFECHNKPDAGCSFLYAYEYTTVTSLVFEKTTSGTLRLSRVMFLDGGSLGQEFREAQARWVRKQVKKLASTSCEAA